MVNIVTFQLLIYLFLSPALAMLLVGDYSPLFLVSLVFFVAFVIGIKLEGGAHVSAACEMPKLKIPKKFFFIYAFLSLIYIGVVIENGIVFRRQGSEFMAELYSSMPIQSLLMLRLFEISYWPVMVSLIYFFRTRSVRVNSFQAFCFIPIVAAFFFTGTLDSRSKLIAPIIFLYILFRHDISFKNIIKSKKGFLTLLILTILFFAVGASRMGAYDSIPEFVMTEFVQRTDGLELLSRVSSELGAIPFAGTRDPLVFLNFVAMIPFLDQAAELKALGLTSSKGYLLAQVLGSNKMDINNSVLTDPYYFGGVLGVIVFGLLYGFYTRRIDSIIKNGAIWRSRWLSAFGLAVVLNAWRVETDLFGLIFVVLRDAVICYAIFLIFSRRSYNVEQSCR